MPKAEDRTETAVAPETIPAGMVAVWLADDAPAFHREHGFLDPQTHLRVTTQRQVVAVALVGEACRRAGFVVVES